jgi:hypothetical protein
MQKQNKSLIGQILINGGFLASHDLELALAEQRRTNELLGKVLVRMGVLDPIDLQAALSIQKYLHEPEEAVKIAAGVRKMLGDLLVQAGHLPGDKLEQALAEQKRSGGKLGEILVRMGLLNERQLSPCLITSRTRLRGKIPPGPSSLAKSCFRPVISPGNSSMRHCTGRLHSRRNSVKSSLTEGLPSPTT